jgi:hypothetical protein
MPISSAVLSELIVGPRQARPTQRGSVLIDTEAALASVASMLSSFASDEQPRLVDVLQAAIDAAHASGVPDRTIAIASTISPISRPEVGRVVSGSQKHAQADAGSDWVRPISHRCLGGTIRKYEDEVEGSFVAMAAWCTDDGSQQPSSGSYRLLLLAHGYREPGKPNGLCPVHLYVCTRWRRNR